MCKDLQCTAETYDTIYTKQRIYRLLVSSGAAAAQLGAG